MAQLKHVGREPKTACIETRGSTAYVRQTAASVSPAVREAASAARAKLIELARADNGSPLYGFAAEDLTVADGWVVSRKEATRRDPAAYRSTGMSARSMSQCSTHRATPCRARPVDIP
jgi:hypothetical protein